MQQTKQNIIKFAAIGVAVLLVSGCQGRNVKGDIPLSAVPAGTFVEPPAEYKSVFQPILFDYDKSVIRPDMEGSLQKVAEWMKAHSKILLRLEGNCDERGTEEYNLGLGERRALGVRKFLADLGVSPDRMTTISYGEEKPVNPAHNEIAWAENRRVEFKLSQ